MSVIGLRKIGYFAFFWGVLVCGRRWLGEYYSGSARWFYWFF